VVNSLGKRLSDIRLLFQKKRKTRKLSGSRKGEYVVLLVLNDSEEGANADMEDAIALLNEALAEKS
jgi:hypothetical protein